MNEQESHHRTAQPVAMEATTMGLTEWLGQVQAVPSMFSFYPSDTDLRIAPCDGRLVPPLLDSTQLLKLSESYSCELEGLILSLRMFQKSEFSFR